MPTPDTRRVIEEWFARAQRGDPKLIELFAEGIVWWHPPGSPLSGTYSGPEEVMAMLRRGQQLFRPDRPLEIAVDGLVVEDGRAAAQVVIRGEAKRGRPYHGHVHFLFEVDNGRITRVKEYEDTAYAHRVLFED